MPHGRNSGTAEQRNGGPTDATGCGGDGHVPGLPKPPLAEHALTGVEGIASSATPAHMQNVHGGIQYGSPYSTRPQGLHRRRTTARSAEVSYRPASGAVRRPARREVSYGPS
ncbi:hypothetical protein, partial [Streptomyces blattellae]|uniref:hypothetical protein n=1 Tax=Streptomyces blattellae TaxID=2569855 RepID=UPI0012B754AF